MLTDGPTDAMDGKPDPYIPEEGMTKTDLHLH